MALHRKFSLPAACFVMALIGLGLGITSRKDGKLASFVLGIGVIFAYYVVMYMAEAMAKGHIVPAGLAMWLPNIALSVFGLFVLLQHNRLSDRRIAIPLPFRRRAPETPAGAGAATPRGRTPAARSRVTVVVRIPQFWVPRFNILDGYLLRLYLRIFGLAFVGMLGIFYIATFIDLSDKMFKGQATSGMLLAYLWYATPQFIYYVLPISALIATLVAIGVLTKNSELVVMKACGISLYRIGMPLIIFGAVWSGVLLALEESVLANANRKADSLRHVIRGGSPTTFDVLNRKWLIGREGNVYHYVYFDHRTREMNGLSVYGIDQEAWTLDSRVFVSRATFANGRWTGHTGWERRFAGESPGFQKFPRRALALEQPDYFVTEQPDAERMNYVQLQRYIAELEASGFDAVPHAVQLQRKLSFPFVTVVMSLLAVPFAITTGRRGALYGIGVAIVLAIAYWIASSIFAAIGSAGMVAPPLAAWAPNVMTLAGATYLLLSART
jgi:LPS export ABC transporter permease LptG